jgi:hypothetical protein
VTDEMKNALYKVPYLREVLVGGEMAKLAFNYMKENVPNHVKDDMNKAYNSALGGRFKAFKNWITEAWSGKTNLENVVGDYEDYLALFALDSSDERISLHEFWDATRAPGDEGDYPSYQKIMNRMGATGDRAHYVGVRQ